MRIDELPQSARIEDRRGIPGGRGGIGIGMVVVLALIGWALGIDPRTLIGGAEMIERRATANEQPIDKAWKPTRRNGQLRVSYPWQYRDGVDRYFRAKWTNLHGANAGYVLRCYTVRLRGC